MRRDEVWGVYDNGRWTGNVGSLADGEVDLLAAPLTLKEGRTEVVDFLLPLATGTTENNE
jgi:ABC-type amino acid transport substrate-binding protein